MDCKALSDVVGAYVDGELYARDKAAVDAHLAGCPMCLSLVHREARLRLAVRAATVRKAPEGLRDRVRSRLAHESSARRTPGDISVHFSGAFTAALVLLMVGISAAGWFAVHKGQPGLADEAALRHARALPLEVASRDVSHVQSWLSGKVDFHPRLPIFHSAAMQLLGARLSHIRDRQAAYLSYGAPDRRTSLFVFDDPGVEPQGSARRIRGRDVFLAQSRGYHIATWKHAGVVYSLVSDLEEPDILALIEQADER